VLTEHCRVCDGRALRPFLDLGDTALANSFVRPGAVPADEPRFPLRLVLCESCGLVQIDEEVPADVLFRDYIYVSGTSDLIHRHARFLASHFVEGLHLKPGDLVLEAASNDGTVLKAFQKHGVRTVGIEPAENIAPRAVAAGVETVCAFFGDDTARSVRSQYGPAKLILARHVLAHAAELRDFVAGMCTVLDHDGIATVEAPHLLPFYENLEYDTVYHEHRCYFSVRVLKTLFESAGLELVDVREAAIHGGSILVSAQRRGGPHRVQASVGTMLAREDAIGLHRPGPWLDFARKVERSREALRAEIDRLHAAGKTLAGYGAPAKGMTLLAYCGIGPERLPFVVDRSPYKQGLLTPGHHIPVDEPGRLLRERPDVVLILAWNFAAEIVQQQAEYLRRGGRFLLPIPVAHYCYEGGGAARAA